MSILLTCSAGGHLTEMRQLEAFYSIIPHFFVTFKRPDTESLAKKSESKMNEPYSEIDSGEDIPCDCGADHEDNEYD